MCNRFRSIHAAENAPRALRDALRLNFPSGWNVSPTDLAPIVAGSLTGPPEGILARFGFNLYGRLVTNARADKIRDGKLHKVSMKARRCVIPALGFYDSRDEEGGKQPYLFERKDGVALNLAGIWEDAEYKGDRRPAFLIVTEDPNDLIRPYHERMPFALADDQVMRWLDLSQPVMPDPSMLLPLDLFSVRPMHKAVNKSAVKDLDLIDPEAAAVRTALGI